MTRYAFNYFRIGDLDGKKIVTTEHGSWVILDKKEYTQIFSKKMDKKLEKKLYDKGVLLDEKKSIETEDLLRTKKRNIFLGTNLHIVVPTLRCNLECVYCHASKQKINKKDYDMDKKTAKKTVDLVFQTTSPFVTIEFQGGEPLLNLPIVKYIIGYANKKNITAKKDLRFAIVTNLTLMNEKILDYLIKNKVSISTSLDGPKKLHNNNRPNSYEPVTYWIKKINQEYKKRKMPNRTGALITITKPMLNHPKQVVDEYVKQGLDMVHLRFLNNLGDARPEWRILGYTPEEFIKFYDEAFNYIKELQKNGVNIKERTYDIFNTKVNTPHDTGYVDIQSPCGAIIKQLLYNYNGKIYTCDEGRMVGDETFVVGNVFEDDYASLTTGKTCINMVTASTLESLPCDACVYKPYCGVCPVCNYAEQGSVIAKTPQTARCKIYKHIIKKVIIDTHLKQKDLKRNNDIKKR